jgi:Uncharacterized protein conserved in bacteria
MADPVLKDSKGSPGEGGNSGAAAALFGCCPRCGERTLFGGQRSKLDFAQFAMSCSACGLDFTQFNVGDGPAAFLTLIIGTVVTGLAIWLQLAAEPPFWVHVILWVPITAALVLGGLRMTKAWLLQAEYRRKASEAVNTEWTIERKDGE